MIAEEPSKISLTLPDSPFQTPPQPVCPPPPREVVPTSFASLSTVRFQVSFGLPTLLFNFNYLHGFNTNSSFEKESPFFSKTCVSCYVKARIYFQIYVNNLEYRTCIFDLDLVTKATSIGYLFLTIKDNFLPR